MSREKSAPHLSADNGKAPGLTDGWVVANQPVGPIRSDDSRRENVIKWFGLKFCYAKPLKV